MRRLRGSGSREECGMQLDACKYGTCQRTPSSSTHGLEHAEHDHKEQHPEGPSDEVHTKEVMPIVELHHAVSPAADWS